MTYERTEMSKLPARETIVAASLGLRPRCQQHLPPGTARKPPLCLKWVLDPTTGKPVMLWFLVEPAEAGGSFALESAA
jgi:hypothetical protein